MDVMLEPDRQFFHQQCNRADTDGHLSLRRWSIEHKLPDDWFLELATALVEQPTSEERDAQEWIMDPITRIVSDNDDPWVTFKYPSWIPTMTTRSDYEKVVTSSFRKHLKEHCDETAADSVARGLVRVPVQSYEHFYWLAGYQIRSWSMNRIAEAVGVTRSTVYADTPPKPVFPAIDAVLMIAPSRSRFICRMHACA